MPVPAAVAAARTVQQMGVTVNISVQAVWDLHLGKERGARRTGGGVCITSSRRLHHHWSSASLCM